MKRYRRFLAWRVVALRCRAVNTSVGVRTIRWGILGVGVISDDFVAGLKLTPGIELMACWSRSPERAQAFAERHRMVPCATLEALLKSEVEVVYVATPP